VGWHFGYSEFGSQTRRERKKLKPFTSPQVWTNKSPATPAAVLSRRRENIARILWALSGCVHERFEGHKTRAPRHHFGNEKGPNMGSIEASFYKTVNSGHKYHQIGAMSHAQESEIVLFV
jgi:hypothetical protein